MRTTQKSIAKKLGLDVSSVNKILNQRSSPLFSQKTIQRVWEAARKMGYDFSRLRFTHRRRDGRVTVSVKTEVVLLTRRGENLIDQGTAMITSLSTVGAFLTQIQLPKRCFPVDPFIVSLRPVEGPLKGYDLKGKIVRLQMNGGVEVGIEFFALDERTKADIRRIIGE